MSIQKTFRIFIIFGALVFNTPTSAAHNEYARLATEILGHLVFSPQILYSFRGYYTNEEPVDYMSIANEISNTEIKQLCIDASAAQKIMRDELGDQEILLYIHTHNENLAASRVTRSQKIIYLSKDCILDLLYGSQESQNRIRAILHHEYGHIKNRDTALHKAPLYNLLALFGFMITNMGLHEFFPQYFGEHTILTSLATCLVVKILLIQQHKRLEWLADANIPNKKEYLIAFIAFLKSVENSNPTPWWAWPFMEHPSNNERIAYIQERLDTIEQIQSDHQALLPKESSL